MKKTILMALALMIGAAAMAQQTNIPNYVNVGGKAEREVTPNEIYIKITVDENTSKGKVTVAEQEKKMIAALQRLGIDTDKNLQVGNLSGDLQSYVLRKDKTLTTKTYELKVGDANTLSKVFNTLADLNISSASVTRATRSDIEQIRQELRVEAIRNAQANAKVLAEAIGQSIGKATQINEYNYSDPVLYLEDAPMARSKMSVAENYSDSNLEFKNLKVTHTVNAQFELK